ncbi:MAG: fatty acid desaturase [Campylobacterota bacterium]|nr:fatty acid desaturase [Campylobacterota bacterium]
MEHKYADYKDVDQELLQKDIDAIKESIGDPTQEDFDHLLKLEMWGRAFTFGGFFMIFIIVGFESSAEFSGFWFWFLSVLAAVSIGIGNVARWADVTHPILHGAYDKVPNIPYRYTKKGFASGNRRYIDWLDWIKPDAWMFEHNIMHHYHLGEPDDPDNVEKNMVWLHDSKIPMFFKYAFVYVFAAVWKLAYYAPNTLRILGNKEKRKNNEPETMEYEISPLKPNGLKLWKDYILPYGIVNFIFLPLLFFPLGMDAIITAFIIIVMGEIYANFHSFAVITPNHSADDIYQFSTPHKTQGEYYLRQIMGSVNYNTGSDFIDFCHGFLNYQVEHHIFPDRTHFFYQKSQPIIKEICKKHNLEYRQESVFKRFFMTVELMVGKTKVLRVEGV